MDFDHFAPEHSARLQGLLGEPDWQEVLHDGTLAAAARDLTAPPPIANVFALPVEQLKALNGARVQALIAAGERDEERLLAELGTWPAQWPAELPVRLSFVGINLSFACDMQPRCVYCNQQAVTECVTVEDWKRVLRSLKPAGPIANEATPADSSKPAEGVYVYFSGGEPLLLGEDLWGPEGLIRTAGEAGAACNVNTNALTLTPRAALGLVSSGTGRLHISLDTHRAEIGDAIFQAPGRWAQTLRGLLNVQIAKSLLGVTHPVIHLNCVLTRLNADDFPAFLRFLLDMKPLVPGGLSPDLDFHLIPVGGAQNDSLRLTAEQYERFFTETWAAADAVWQAYQAEREVPEGERKSLHEKMPFLSPYHRVQQHGDLRQWSRNAAAGLPGALALCERCYVAPTQGFLLPNGAQYWCGGHAISRPEPVGDFLAQGIAENIQQALEGLAKLPGASCRTCPGATQAINQTVEGRLRQTIREWLNPEEAAEGKGVEETDIA